MAKIVISVLDPQPIKGFIHQLIPEETEAILGGGYPYGFHIINATDSININNLGGDNTIEAGGLNSISYHDNSIHSIDYSGSIYNTFI